MNFLITNPPTLFGYRLQKEMDKPIKQNIGNKNLTKGVILMMLILIISYVFLYNSKTTSAIDKNKLIFSEVKKDVFEESISFSAVVEPKVSINILATEGGQVTEVFSEAGKQIRKGDKLLELENPDLILDFLNRETQIIEQINNLRNLRITLESNQRADQEQILDLDYKIELINRKYIIDSSLFKSDVISKNDYNNSESEYSYLKKKKEYLDKNQIQNKEYRKHQILQIDESIKLMQRNLKAIKKHLDNLIIKSPATGMLTSFEFSEGERINKNQSVGKIDFLDKFKAVALIDEHYLSKVKLKMKGTFTLSGGEEDLVIYKIFPTVINGEFKVEFLAENDLTSKLKIGQTIHIKMPISTKNESLIISKGEFFRATSGKWVYVLAEEGKAEKRMIKLGKQNDQYFEVKSGLNLGDIVITSSYDEMENAEILNIK